MAKHGLLSSISLKTQQKLMCDFGSHQIIQADAASRRGLIQALGGQQHQMKYKVFFVVMASYLAYIAIENGQHWLWYPVASLVVMAISYIFNSPKLVMGKDKNGKINYFIVIINLPWLLFTYSIFAIQYFMSREDKANKIIKEIYIGCYPCKKKAREYDYVIDLTSEFPSSQKYGGKYSCLANLDGINLSQYFIPDDLSISDKILIHCAQGHGRSATYCSMLLIKMGLAKDCNEALTIIQKSRPAARPSKYQIKQIESAQQVDAPGRLRRPGDLCR